MRATIAIAAGVLAALGQAPYDQPLAFLVALTIAFILLRCQDTSRAAAGFGWLFGVGYFGLALVWILQPFQIDPDRHGWMAPFALIFMSGGLALFWAGAFWLSRRLSPATWPLVFTWTGAEVLRAYVFTGFPWAGPAQALVNGQAGQGMAWIGPHGMTLCLMAFAWFLSTGVGAYRPRLLRLGQGAALGIATALFYLPPLAPDAPLTTHVVRLVQPNAQQDLKWQPDFAQMFFERQLALTSAPPGADRAPPDLTIWPETAVPWLLEDAGAALEMVSKAADGRAVALGILRRDGAALYNSMAVIEDIGNPAQIYDKHHLVPFGEYIPMAGLARRFGWTGLAQVSSVGFRPGPGARALDFGPLGMGLPLICYEAVFAHDVNVLEDRPDFLIQITNDAWFGHDAGPLQHLAQARMRAIEQGLPMMRAANTGISAMIDPQGRILARLPMGEAGFVDARLPAPARVTLYSRSGDLPLVLLLCSILTVATVRSLNPKLH